MGRAGRALVAAVGLSIAAGPGALAQSPRAAFENTPAIPHGDALEVEVASPLDPADLDGDMRTVRLDLRDGDDRAALRTHLQRLHQLAKNQDDFADAHPERVLPFRYDVRSKGKRQALQDAIALTDRLRAPSAAPTDNTLLHLAELLNAIQNSFRYPVKKNYQVIPEILPGLLLKMRAHRTVPPPAGATAAAPTADPPASSFWSGGGDLARMDLYAGFGRRAPADVAGVTCTYVEPKTGWGAHPGFHVKCGSEDLRFKLGNEIYGGPFNTRIFDALGYHTYPIDDAPVLRLKYDRRVLTQFHSRRRLAMHVKLLFVNLLTRVVTDEEDAFSWIDHAVMKDGRRVPASELKAALLRDPRARKDRPHPETIDANYRADFESGIEALVWKPGTIASEPESVRQIGAWDYDQLDHAARREVRGVFVLAAWLDEHNMRWENTRLSAVEGPGGRRLWHFFSDVGTGMGLARDMRHTRNSDVESMLWEVTERKADGRVRFSGFAPNVGNRAFSGMTWQDARWMLRRMGRFSEQQVLQALLATGMSAAEVRLALEKLLSKRRRMVLDFGLAGEFPDIVSRRIDRSLDFDPLVAAQLRAVTLARGDGTVVAPRAGEWVVVRGHLARRAR